MTADEALKKISERSILYTDTIHGRQTCVDNLWAATTDEIDAIEAELKALRCAPRFSQEELEAMRECAERTQDEYSGTELWVPSTAAATLFRMIKEGSNGR